MMYVYRKSELGDNHWLVGYYDDKDIWVPVHGLPTRKEAEDFMIELNETQKGKPRPVHFMLTIDYLSKKEGEKVASFAGEYNENSRFSEWERYCHVVKAAIKELGVKKEEASVIFFKEFWGE